jgi:hypothetical protein
MVDLLLPHGARYRGGPDAARKAVHYQRNGQALIDAVVDGDEKRVRTLLDQGTPMDFVERGILSPFLIAAQNGEAAIVKLFLSRGMAPEGPAIPKQERPLDAAVSGGLRSPRCC